MMNNAQRGALGRRPGSTTATAGAVSDPLAGVGIGEHSFSAERGARRLGAGGLVDGAAVTAVGEKCCV